MKLKCTVSMRSQHKICVSVLCPSLCVRLAFRTYSGPATIFPALPKNLPKNFPHFRT